MVVVTGSGSSRARRGIVRLDGVPVGVIEERDGGAYVFTYDAAWCDRPRPPPISLTMPVRREPYVHQGLHPFFENLLPEGWLLEISTRALKIPKDDAFGLLIATCGDCIGNVEILPDVPGS